MSDLDKTYRDLAEYYLSKAVAVSQGQYFRSADLDWPQISGVLEYIASHKNLIDARLSALIFALGPYWKARGMAHEWVKWSQFAITNPVVRSDRKLLAGHIAELGIAYSELGQLQVSIDYLKQALAIFREIDESETHIILNHIGGNYRILGQMEQAKDYLEQALRGARASGDRDSEGHCLGNLGGVYFDLGQYANAIEYFEQALAIVREQGDRQSEANQLSNLGVAYRNLGNTDMAVKYHQQARGIYQEIGDWRGEAINLGSLGNAYIVLGRAQQAIECLEQAVSILQKIGDRITEASNLFNLGLAYSMLGQVDRAIYCIEQALPIFDELRSPHSKSARETLAKLKQKRRPSHMQTSLGGQERQAVTIHTRDAPHCYEVQLEKAHIIVRPDFLIIKAKRFFGGWKESTIPIEAVVCTRVNQFPPSIIIETERKKYGPYAVDYGTASKLSLAIMSNLE